MSEDRTAALGGRRAPFDGDLERSLEETAGVSRPPCVMVLVIEDAQAIRDLYGAGAYKELMGHVATRIIGSTRSSDVVLPSDYDEFVIALTTLDDARSAGVVAEHIRRRVAAPILLRGHPVHVSVRIGAAVSDGTRTADDLLRVASRVAHEGPVV